MYPNKPLEVISNSFRISIYVLYKFIGFMTINTLLILGVISTSDLGFALLWSDIDWQPRDHMNIFVDILLRTLTIRPNVHVEWEYMFFPIEPQILKIVKLATSHFLTQCLFIKCIDICASIDDIFCQATRTCISIIKTPDRTTCQNVCMSYHTLMQWDTK